MWSSISNAGCCITKEALALLDPEFHSTTDHFPSSIHSRRSVQNDGKTIHFRSSVQNPRELGEEILVRVSVSFRNGQLISVAQLAEHLAERRWTLSSTQCGNSCGRKILTRNSVRVCVKVVDNEIPKRRVVRAKPLLTNYVTHKWIPNEIVLG